MTDLFGSWVPDDWLERIFGVMALAHWHTFLPLTKRTSRMRAWFDQPRTKPAVCECVAAVYVDQPEVATRWPFDLDRAVAVGTRGWPLPNVWLGASVEDQPRADERVWDLIQTPAAVRVISAEPLLSGIDFTRIACPTGRHPPDYCNRCHPDGGEPTGTFDALARGAIDQIIVGCESGRGRRPCDLADVRAIRDQCAAAGVSFFLKQLIVGGRRVPPPIALTDLDRDELLRLLSGRFMAFTAGDLWRARWDTLSERATAARARASEALAVYTAPQPALSSCRLKGRRLIRALDADEARRSAWKRADAAAKRAEAAEESAWRALEACERGRIVA